MRDSLLCISASSGLNGSASAAIYSFISGRRTKVITTSRCNSTANKAGNTQGGNIFIQNATRIQIRLCVFARSGNNRSNIISYSLVMKEIQSEKNGATSESAYEIFVAPFQRPRFPIVPPTPGAARQKVNFNR